MAITIKTETIRARVTPGLKRDAEVILHKLGISTTEAITIFFRQIVMNKGIPFDVKIPNEETQIALEEIRAGKGFIKTNLDELRSEFK